MIRSMVKFMFFSNTMLVALSFSARIPVEDYSLNIVVACLAAGFLTTKRKEVDDDSK